MPFVIPPKFHRNSADVLALGPPADTGAKLIEHMAHRIGRTDLAGLDVLDMGCGTRFADTFMNRPVPVGSYTGIDVWGEMVDFLRANAVDPRLSFHRFDAHNPHYCSDGALLTGARELPVGDRRFDLACMFSVISHQVPDEAQALFEILRRYTRPDGRMFFTAWLDDESGLDYYEHDPANPAAWSFYSGAKLRRMLADSGWSIVSVAPPGADELPMGDSFLCAPA